MPDGREDRRKVGLGRQALREVGRQRGQVGVTGSASDLGQHGQRGDRLGQRAFRRAGRQVRRKVPEERLLDGRLATGLLELPQDQQQFILDGLGRGVLLLGLIFVGDRPRPQEEIGLGPLGHVDDRAPLDGRAGPGPPLGPALGRHGGAHEARLQVLQAHPWPVGPQHELHQERGVVLGQGLQARLVKDGHSPEIVSREEFEGLDRKGVVRPLALAERNHQDLARRVRARDAAGALATAVADVGAGGQRQQAFQEVERLLQRHVLAEDRHGRQGLDARCGRVDGAVEAGQFVAERLGVGQQCAGPPGGIEGGVRAFRLAAHREEEPEQRFQEFGVLLGRHLFQDHHEVIEGNLASLDGGHPGGLQVLGAVVAGQGQHPGHGLRQRLGVLISRPNGHPCVLGVPRASHHTVLRPGVQPLE